MRNQLISIANCLGTVLLLGLPSSTWAQAPHDSLPILSPPNQGVIRQAANNIPLNRAEPLTVEQRIQQLEDQLRSQRAESDLLRRQLSVSNAAVVERLDALAEDKAPAKGAEKDSKTSTDDAKLKKAIAAYMKEQDEKKKKDEEAKKAEGYEVGSDLKMSASWKNGLELSTANKDFRVHVGGRTQFDVGWFAADRTLYTPAGGPTTGLGNTYGDGVDFRRARLRIDGTMYETIEWAAEYDFVNSAALGAQPTVTTTPFTPGNLANQPRSFTAPTDLWWMFKDVPFLQNIKIGNQKEQIGFEHIVSSRYQPFMERSYNQDSFYGGAFNGFTPGINVLGTYGEDEAGTYSLGLFKPTNNVFAFNTGDGDYSVCGRLTRLLVYENEGERLLHVGVSLRQATAVSQAIGSNGSTTSARVIQYRTRDAIRTGLSADWPTPANITLFGDDTQQINAELVGVLGRWTFQSEYLVSALQDARRNEGDPMGNVAVYHGGYVQLLYFLTDDHDHYHKKNGAFERITPRSNAYWVKDAGFFGPGAWQVGARYNYLDLNDSGLNGGILHNITGGVNWFLNPNMKLQFNYIATHRDAPLAGTTGDGWVHGWGMRLAHDF